MARKSGYGPYGTDLGDALYAKSTMSTMKATATKPKKKGTTTPRVSAPVQAALKDAPMDIRVAFNEVYGTAMMNDALMALWDRHTELESKTSAMLAGAFLNPIARRFIADALDTMWQGNTLDKVMKANKQEVVIGSGLHAAIYCAVRVACGAPKPLVLEQSDRVGGTFAVTSNPSFYLNSRNRPGPLGMPGMYDNGSLNYLPGAPVQPSDLSSAEYADNASLAWAIRMTLMMYANVVTNAKVKSIDGSKVILDGGVINASQVVVATGVGQPKTMAVMDQNVVTYLEFMRSLDEPFPFRDMGRVAVIGAGDSGRTVIEALCGQGPSNHWSIAALDYVKQIDWYGVKNILRGDWENRNRSRYKGIARLFPCFDNNVTTYNPASEQDEAQLRPGRVNPIVAAGKNISVGFGEVMINSKPYDKVILCTGYDVRQRIIPLDDYTFDANSYLKFVGDQPVARLISNGGVPLYIAGPAAQLAVTDMEKSAAPVLSTIPENSASIFRYARKTAALARSMS